MSGGEFVSALARSSCDMWCVWLTAFAALQAWLALYAAERKKAMACGIQQIDDGDIETFEQFISAVVRQAGFQIEKNVPAGLDGSDLVIAKNGKRAAVLLRKSGTRAGARTVHATLLRGEHHGLAKVILISNNFYTRKAAALARSKNVLLWNRRNLINALLEMREKQTAVPLPLPRTRRTRAAPERTRQAQARVAAHPAMSASAAILHILACCIPHRSPERA